VAFKVIPLLQAFSGAISRDIARCAVLLRQLSYIYLYIMLYGNHVSCVPEYGVYELDLQFREIMLYIQVDSAVVVLAEDAGDKSSGSAKKVSTKKDLPSGKKVLQKVQMQLDVLKKKIGETNDQYQYV